MITSIDYQRYSENNCQPETKLKTKKKNVDLFKLNFDFSDIQFFHIAPEVARIAEHKGNDAISGKAVGCAIELDFTASLSASPACDEEGIGVDGTRPGRWR